MKRKEFITLLGVGAGTVVVASCLGGCSKGSDGPAPDPNPDPTVPVLTINNVTIDTDLENTGWTIKNGIIVAKSGGNYIALAGVCTHAGNSMTYSAVNNNFPCSLTNPPNPGHGSVFDANGVKIAGPSGVANLKKYTTKLTGTKLEVFA